MATIGVAGGRGSIWGVMTTQDLKQKVRIPNERTRGLVKFPTAGNEVRLGRVKP